MRFVRVLTLATGMVVGAAVLLGSAAVGIGRAGEVPFERGSSERGGSDSFDRGRSDPGQPVPDRWDRPFEWGA